MKIFRHVIIVIVCSCKLFHLSAQCPEISIEGLTFSSQSEIDQFFVTYPNCTELELAGGVANVLITGEDIINLNGLQNITRIDGGLSIIETSLITASGLENLETTHSLLIRDNLNLISLEGLNY